jgi:hypothetical protein
MVKQMSNIEDFNKGAALVLERLYEAFPQTISLDVSQLDSESVDQNTVRNYGATIEFLISEEFISGEDPDGRGIFFPSLILTSKGLAILHSVPDVLKENTTLGRRISNVLKEGSKEAIKGALNTVISQVITMAVTGQFGSHST